MDFTFLPFALVLLASIFQGSFGLGMKFMAPLKWDLNTLPTYQYKNHNLTDGSYRYTWYGGRANGTEELYDHSIYPLEHNNLASNSKYKEIITRFQKYLPSHNEPNSPNNKLSGEDKKKMTKGKKNNEEE